MRLPLVALSMTLTLTGPALTAQAADPAADVARSYAVRAIAEPASLKAAATGTIRFFIEPTGEVHVDPKAPFKLTLAATPGLSLPKTQLGRADTVQSGPGVNLEAPFTATAAGPQEVKARLEFFLCTDQWCVKQTRDLVVKVDVK
jgi:hypothetical protein